MGLDILLTNGRLEFIKYGISLSSFPCVLKLSLGSGDVKEKWRRKGKGWSSSTSSHLLSLYHHNSLRLLDEPGVCRRTSGDKTSCPSHLDLLDKRHRSRIWRAKNEKTRSITSSLWIFSRKKHSGRISHGERAEVTNGGWRCLDFL